MSTGEHDLDTDSGTTLENAGDEVTPAPKRKLDLDVQISDVGPCKKHLKVAIGKSEIDRQFDESLRTMKKEAAVPGFRPGRAPRQLIEKRFRKQVAEQVKSTLLMSALEQLDEEYKLNPITQPNLDLEAIQLPEDGPMRFEIEVEVRPEFALPDYKSLTIKKPIRTVTDADVEAQYKSFLERYAQLVPKAAGGAELGDFLTADLLFHLNGVTLNEAKEIQFRLQPELRFQDGTVPDIGTTLLGVQSGEVRETEARIGANSADPVLRGNKIRVTFTIQDLKQLRLPEVDDAFLHRIGFDTKEELETALREILVRRFAAAQRQAIRSEVLSQLSGRTPFDLPADLVSRQERSTVRKLVSQLKEEGLTESGIRARESEIRANAHETTLRTLKEFFILAKIADAESIKVEDADLDQEIDAIASRTGDSIRRVRSRLEKEGAADMLASDILEKKTLDKILEFVTFEEVPLIDRTGVETLDQAVGPVIEEASEESPPAETAKSEDSAPEASADGEENSNPS